jgi:hypothetical protein
MTQFPDRSKRDGISLTAEETMAALSAYQVSPRTPPKIQELILNHKNMNPAIIRDKLKQLGITDESATNLKKIAALILHSRANTDGESGPSRAAGAPRREPKPEVAPSAPARVLAAPDVVEGSDARTGVRGKGVPRIPVVTAQESSGADETEVFLKLVSGGTISLKYKRTDTFDQLIERLKASGHEGKLVFQGAEVTADNFKFFKENIIQETTAHFIPSAKPSDRRVPAPDVVEEPDARTGVLGIGTPRVVAAQEPSPAPRKKSVRWADENDLPLTEIKEIPSRRSIRNTNEAAAKKIQSAFKRHRDRKTLSARLPQTPAQADGSPDVLASGPMTRPLPERPAPPEIPSTIATKMALQFPERSPMPAPAITSREKRPRATFAPLPFNTQNSQMLYKANDNLALPAFVPKMPPPIPAPVRRPTSSRIKPAAAIRKKPKFEESMSYQVGGYQMEHNPLFYKQPIPSDTTASAPTPRPPQIPYPTTPALPPPPPEEYSAERRPLLDVIDSSNLRTGVTGRGAANPSHKTAREERERAANLVIALRRAKGPQIIEPDSANPIRTFKGATDSPHYVTNPMKSGAAESQDSNPTNPQGRVASLTSFFGGSRKKAPQPPTAPTEASHARAPEPLSDQKLRTMKVFKSPRVSLQPMRTRKAS